MVLVYIDSKISFVRQAIIAGLSDIVNTASNQISSTNGSAPITAENDANQLLADFTVVSVSHRLCTARLTETNIARPACTMPAAIAQHSHRQGRPLRFCAFPRPTGRCSPATARVRA